MKNIFRSLLILVVICLSITSGCTQKSVDTNETTDIVQYTLREAFDIYLESNGISGEVLYFTTDHYNSEQEMQAFALVDTDGICDLWYTDSQTVKMLAGDITVAEAPTTVTASSKQIYIIDGTTADGVTQSYAYIVSAGQPIRLTGTGEDLTFMGGDDFFTLVTSADRQLCAGKMTGQSHKKYYLYFDGTSFKEYGGIKISESEFMQLNKSDVIINSITECGYTVTEFIYRANGLININCEKKVNDETIYENLTVKVLKNNGVCIPSGLNQSTDYVGRSSYGGKYELAAFPLTATYPDEFAVEQ